MTKLNMVLPQDFFIQKKAFQLSVIAIIILNFFFYLISSYQFVNHN